MYNSCVAETGVSFVCCKATISLASKLQSPKLQSPVYTLTRSIPVTSGTNLTIQIILGGIALFVGIYAPVARQVIIYVACL